MKRLSKMCRPVSTRRLVMSILQHAFKVKSASLCCLYFLLLATLFVCIGGVHAASPTNRIPVSRYAGQEIIAKECGIDPASFADYFAGEPELWGLFGEERVVFESIIPFQTATGKFGIKKSGRVINEPIYDAIEYCTLSSFWAKRAEKWFIVNEKGGESNESFEKINRFFDGVAVVQSGQKWGLIDSKLQWIIEPTFDDADIRVREGILAYCLNSRWGFVRMDGKILADNLYDGASGFASGVAIVQNNNKCALIRSDMTLVTTFDYDYAFRPSDGVVAVCMKGKWGFIDIFGKSIVPCEYDFAFRFRQGVGYVIKAKKLIPVYLDGRLGVVVQPISSAPQISDAISGENSNVNQVDTKKSVDEPIEK